MNWLMGLGRNVWAVIRQVGLFFVLLQVSVARVLWKAVREL